MSASTQPALVHPSRRPGALRYARLRALSILNPPVTIYDPAPGSLVVERDVAVVVRDGTTLRVNVFRPLGPGPFPVLMSAHPYGKDRLPKRGRRGYRKTQYRIMRQTGPLTISSLTSWEAPDPVWWVQQGYAVVNADVRGGGHSDGRAALLSDQEADDVHDLVEWAGTQAWSTGRVGLLGVSYLAISQYKAAATHPPHLAAICPWEGFTDPYRDLFYPGGIRENGFTSVWTTLTRRVARLAVDLRSERKRHPLRDDWWKALTPDLAAITVPMLVCSSFSDNSVHTRGSFRAFEQVSSVDRFAYTHRDGKWTAFYGDTARHAQLAFLDRFVAGRDAPDLPPVRLEVRAARDEVVAVRDEREWPLARTRWTPLYLGADGRLTDDAPTRPGSITFNTRHRAAAFSWTAPTDVELTGPMSVRLWVQAHHADDIDLVVGVEKWRGNSIVAFEGSYGWGRDRVSTGWQKVSLRATDPTASTPGAPVHPLDRPAPLHPGEVVPLDVGLGESATQFRAGDTLRLVVAGRWLSTRNPLTGQMPGHYRCRHQGRITLHWGPDRPAHLLTPQIPNQSHTPGRSAAVAGSQRGSAPRPSTTVAVTEPGSPKLAWPRNG